MFCRTGDVIFNINLKLSLQNHDHVFSLQVQRKIYLGSRITVDLNAMCIKVPRPSQTMWLIRSHWNPGEQGVEGRDQWHNGLCQTAPRNAQAICGDNPDAISSIMGPHSSHKQT